MQPRAGLPCSCGTGRLTSGALLCSFGVIMWEVVTREIPVRGALRTIDVPQEAPEEGERCHFAPGLAARASGPGQTGTRKT